MTFPTLVGMLYPTELPVHPFLGPMLPFKSLKTKKQSAPTFIGDAKIGFLSINFPIPGKLFH